MAAPRFTQAAVTKAVAGAIKGGLEIGRVEIAPDGRITIFAPGHEKTTPEDELAAWMAEHADDPPATTRRPRRKV